jgi:hypothetical protein
MNKTLELLLSPTQQLISINDGLAHFSADISVSSTSGAPFEIAVLNEEKLGDNSNLEFIKADTGTITMKVDNKKGGLDNWYIALKSDADNNVKVSISVSEVTVLADTTVSVPAAKEKIPWAIIIAGVVLAVSAGVYFVFRKNKDKQPPAIVEMSSPGPRLIVDDDFLAKISQLPEI